ncbi:MAG: YHS domain-containing protein [Planctomycetota bacterium]
MCGKSKAFSISISFGLLMALAILLSTANAEEPETSTNAICPVMEGNAVNPDIFTTYKGKKVFFCCLSCKENFEKEPEKYLARLPQFATAETESAENHEHGFAWRRLVKPLGITTLSLLAITVCLGFLTRKNFQLLFKWHRLSAILTFISALCHAILVFLAQR